jgi:rhodanese-related sulfurtransferase
MPTYRKKPIDAVIDVRSHLEFWLGHLPGAICVPVDALPGSMPGHKDITKDSHILVYCGSGVRSATAASTLSALGYRHVTDGGGMAAAREHFEQ